jgi:ribosome-binding protein aMBF1 (putative translation factor)
MHRKPWRSPAAFVKRLLADPETRILYEIERAKTELALVVRGARKRAGLTQAQLAERIHTSQSVISRLESGGDLRTPTLGLLAKIAEACDGHLEVRFRFSRAA